MVIETRLLYLCVLLLSNWVKFQFLSRFLPLPFPADHTPTESSRMISIYHYFYYFTFPEYIRRTATVYRVFLDGLIIITLGPRGLDLWDLRMWKFNQSIHQSMVSLDWLLYVSTTHDVVWLERIEPPGGAPFLFNVGAWSVNDALIDSRISFFVHFFVTFLV